MNDFPDLIYELHLIDLPLRSGDCTWTNGHSWSRIDRFLISLSWEAAFLEIIQTRLAKHVSNNYPILLD